MEMIIEKLRVIEESKQVKILYACETGSRAWGFSSPDSDFDVRFIYKRHSDWYLSLNNQKDTLEIMEGDLDITGWDLKKSLVLLKRSNAPLIERFQSPIVYQRVAGFEEDFRNLVKQYYSPVSVFYHHYSLAKKIWEEIKDFREVKLKSFFYLVRSLLSCNWILEDDSIVPMNIVPLMNYIPGKVSDQLRSLIDLKSTKNESYLYPSSPELNSWIETMFGKIEMEKNKPGVNRNSMELLNQFFLKQLYA